MLTIVFFPFWFRFAQCLRRYHDTKLKPNLTNAGKYFTVILIHFANIFRAKLQTIEALYIVIVLTVFSTLYSYAWDLYMDWGLLRSSWRDPSGKRLLRPKTLFPAWFYYYAAISNFILRFLWVLPLIKTLPEWMNSM